VKSCCCRCCCRLLSVASVKASRYNKATLCTSCWVASDFFQPSHPATESYGSWGIPLRTCGEYKIWNIKYPIIDSAQLESCDISHSICKGLNKMVAAWSSFPPWNKLLKQLKHKESITRWQYQKVWNANTQTVFCFETCIHMHKQFSIKKTCSDTKCFRHNVYST